jgi:hypothetical protein
MTLIESNPARTVALDALDAALDASAAYDAAPEATRHALGVVAIAAWSTWHEAEAALLPEVAPMSVAEAITARDLAYEALLAACVVKEEARSEPIAIERVAYDAWSTAHNAFVAASYHVALAEDAL